MDFDQFQEACERTANPGHSRPEDRLANFALGLCGEAGEVVEPIKKHLFHGKALDRDALTKELGDVLWYVATLASTLGIPLSVVAERNVAKLRERWPDGFKPAGQP